jgi:hypothetical protein
MTAHVPEWHVVDTPGKIAEGALCFFIQDVEEQRGCAEEARITDAVLSPASNSVPIGDVEGSLGRSCQSLRDPAGWSPLPFHLLRAASAEADLEAAITGRGFRIAVPWEDTSDELMFQRVMHFSGADRGQRWQDRPRQLIWPDLSSGTTFHPHLFSDDLWGFNKQADESTRRAGKSWRRWIILISADWLPTLHLSVAGLPTL